VALRDQRKRELMEPIRRRRIDPEVEHRRGVIVALLRRHPDGLTAREIGEATGISRNLTASALSGLFTRGVLHKRGHRYVLAARDDATDRSSRG
jgi:DNA-binding transcriptional regulator GbsR (MarR family)